MSYGEFLDWEKFFLVEPPLPERVDLMGALVTSTIANVNRSKSRKPYSVEDFLIIKGLLRQEYEQEFPPDSTSREEIHFFNTMTSLQRAFADA